MLQFDKKQFPLLAGAITILLSFVGCEYIRRRPIDQAAENLSEVLKEHKRIECDFLRKSNSPDYDKKCS